VHGPGAAVLEVTDTITALQRLAQSTRTHWGKPVIAVTGSAGKTSTKEIIASLLSLRFTVGKTVGNFNNHIGLPLTLLRIPETAEVAVIEMGMNHAGEIRDLAAIARPQIGVVTNVGYAHIEAFDSVEGIAAAKRELIEALPADGLAVLNADDQRVIGFRGAHLGKVLTYGIGSDADIQAENMAVGPDGAAFTVRGVRFETKLTGRHAVSNILAGLVVASSFAIPLADLVRPVAELIPGKMRGQRTEVRGVKVLNDSYNSNPEAARSMIDVLMGEPAQRRIAVLGEMLELGAWADKLHRDLGRYAAERGVDVLVGVCGASRAAVAAVSDAGREAFFFDDAESAGEFLRGFVRQGDAVLFKGSRGTHVERALAGMEG
nr:UDP-N-acetylmuramoyl-tripeptide--D-alanyl-D-alanine ligase [Acidobacteriota bacterium]